MRSFILVLLSFLSCGLFADDLVDFDKQEIQERIKPIGQVRLQEQKSAPAVAKQQPVQQAEKKEPGQATYEQYCIACHRDGIAGAPKFGDAADWKPYLAGRTIDDLVASATKGKNAMPPKGTCGNCTDSDLKVAIQYMMPKS